MKFRGTILKYQNLYTQQETTSWQVTIELEDSAVETVVQFRKQFLGDVCQVRVFSEDNEVEFTAEAYEGTTRNNSKGTTNKLYLRLPESNVGRESFKKLMDFVNTGCKFEIYE